jgi:predicted GNAT family acetyltransferase
MTTEVTDNRERGHYELHVDGQLAGWIVYRSAPPGVVTMVHTEIEPEWEGHGLGSLLAAGALDDVRARGLKVRPLCPFVAGYLERHPEYADVVAAT